jgi:LacI family transcriptional regulator
VDNPPAVAVLVDTSSGWGRRLIRGITNFSLQHGPWHLWVEARGRTERMTLPRNWDGMGVIARVATQRLAEELKRSGLPVINVSSVPLPGYTFPRVTLDHDSIGKLACEHFVDSGYTRCAFLGPLELPYVQERCDSFRKGLEVHGGVCDVIDYPLSMVSNRQSRLKSSELVEWLTTVPKPVGIFAWAAEWGLQVIDICRYHRIAIPDEVAVLGGDDDPLLCESTIPGLSSIVTQAERNGFVAAEMLDQLMRNQSAPVPALTRLPSEEIQVRGSTDALAIDDSELARAVIFMRRNAYKPLTIDDIAFHVPMTRRSLERKFRKYFERTPFEELRRLRMARVRHLLSSSDMSIPEVAVASGMGDPEHLATTFRKMFGITPLKFRAGNRSR